MQRRIQETDGNRVAFQSLVQLLEVSLLFRKDLLQCCFSLFYGLRTDHLTERINSVAFEEHMLCTAQSDTFSSQLTGFLRVCRCIRIGTYLHGSVLVSPCHDPSELSRDGRVYSRDDAIVDISGRTVDGDRVSFMVLFSCQCELLVLLVHRDIAAAGYTASAHPARYNCRMACHTAANGQDSLCSLHTFDILRRSLQADQNDLFSSCSPLLCVVSGEYDLTAGSSRWSAQSLCDGLSSLQCSSVKLRMKQCVKVSRVDHGNSFFLCTHAFIHQVACDLQSSLSGSLAVSGLQHVQLAVLYGKLHILHVSVVWFQSLANVLELYKSLRKFVFHLGNMHRSADTCNYVLALCIGQELAEQTVLACSRVSGKCNACTAVISHVSECHHLYVDSSSPWIRDIIVTAVYIRSRVIPGTEYGFDRSHELFLRICREVFPDLLFIFRFELSRKRFQVIRSQFYVLLHALFLFHLVDELFKILFADFHNYIGVHLDKSSVAVPCPARIAGSFRKYVYNLFIQTQVQDRVHHTGHRSSSTGTYGNQERILLVTKLLAGNPFHLRDCFHDLAHDLVIDRSAILIILRAGFCCDRKALRHRQTQIRHLGKVRALSAEQVPHGGVTFGKHINPFCHVLMTSLIYILLSLFKSHSYFKGFVVSRQDICT